MLVAVLGDVAPGADVAGASPGWSASVAISSINVNAPEMHAEPDSERTLVIGHDGFALRVFLLSIGAGIPHLGAVGQHQLIPKTGVELILLTDRSRERQTTVHDVDVLSELTALEDVVGLEA